MNRIEAAWARLDEPSREICVGVVLLAAFGLLIFGSSQIVAKISDGIVSANFFPDLISGTGAGLSALLIIMNVIKKLLKHRVAANASEGSQAEAGVEVEIADGSAVADMTISKALELAKEAESEDAEKLRWVHLALSVVLMFLYVFFMKTLGFILSSVVYLIIQILALQRKRDPKTVLLVIGISIFVPLLLFIPFRYIFGLRLPLGILSRWG
jgi:hypothetical protein